MRWLSRMGAAIVAPRLALAIGGDAKVAGRSGSDLLKLFLVVLFATQLRWLVQAGWLAGAVDAGVGVRAVVHVLSRAFAIDLAVVVLATAVIFIAMKRRDIGRAFDLACVAVVPLVLVDMLASTVLHALDLPVVSAIAWTVSGISYLWVLALAILAIRPVEVAEVPRARTAGWGVVAIALAGIAVEGVWIGKHFDLLEPMQDGMEAPAVSLPKIAAGGATSETVTLASLRGKVVVLDFWETWCGPCLAAMPRLDILQRKHPTDLVVLAINMDDRAKARGLFDTRGFALTLLADDFHTSERYGVSTIPHTVVIDRQGIVRHVFRGGSSKIETSVESLLK